MLLRLIVILTCLAGPVAAEYRVALTDTGKRDYYCTITVTLTNESAEPLTEVNAFFLNFIGEEQVGRSKGASFFNVAPGASASAVFETPNAPCQDVEYYEMIIGACRLGSSFEPKAVCANKILAEPPFRTVTTLN
ncbi:MAG: hypothetical protein AAF601_04800 [Pseudomonadota bacterium]